MGPPFSAPGGHPGVTVCRNNPRCRAELREVSDEGQARAHVREPSNRALCQERGQSNSPASIRI
jgi:hypothetical protein